MRLSISNLAWDVGEDDEIAALLGEFGVDAIDVAPGKYFPRPGHAAASEIESVRCWWQDRGISIVGMQALLFGTQGLNLFGSESVRAAMLEHLDAVCRIGSGLGATRLVFGSPKNRDRAGLDFDDALGSAIEFFRQLGTLAAAHAVTICLEPNPTRYGANFMTTSDETANVVMQVGHPAIRMQFDTGALTINGEDASAVLDQHAAFIGHVHASEPDLLPLGDGTTDHMKIGQLLMKHLPEHVVTVEMLATSSEPHAKSIRRALTAAIGAYGGTRRLT
ncbi:Sugar phosphate isomerase/epimerase [Dokdonella immobilis]|uniref:Sugar phosphate isomerase/epimerase n=1 Tax=Dokdonella immobilis TaxID=578942 RepID=A0A1I4ZCY6_9GAMM|nr:Sugar phosphate isomerase/epimerase [Dokdonella immobilis]